MCFGTCKRQLHFIYFYLCHTPVYVQTLLCNSSMVNISSVIVLLSFPVFQCTSYVLPIVLGLPIFVPTHSLLLKFSLSLDRSLTHFAIYTCYLPTSYHMPNIIRTVAIQACCSTRPTMECSHVAFMLSCLCVPSNAAKACSVHKLVSYVNSSNDYGLL